LLAALILLVVRLFLSTLKAYFERKKELFEGLKIAELEKKWAEYPIIYLDFNRESYPNIDFFNQSLDTNLSIHEKKWGKDETETTPASRLVGLIHRAYEKTGQNVVVLIDELPHLCKTQSKQEIFPP